VGLPGDKIRVYRGRLFISDIIVERDSVDNYLYREHKGRKVGVDVYSEQWPGENDAHHIYEQIDTAPLDNTEEFRVPPETVFFMGDNRDNSTDSRAILGPGYVPLSHLIGRAEYMMFSFKRCAKEADLRCPERRVMKKL